MSLDFRTTGNRKRFGSFHERNSESGLDGTAETSRLDRLWPAGNPEHVRAGQHHQHPADGRRCDADSERNRKV